jgi:type VI protein secretion system component Hcp
MLAVFAGTDVFSTPSNSPLTIDNTALLANDSGVNRVTGVTQPTRGTLTGVAGGYQYTPAPGFVGTDQFTYAAQGDRGVPGNLLTIPATNGNVGGEVRVASYTFGISRVPGLMGNALPELDNLVIDVEMGSTSPGFFGGVAVGRSMGTNSNPVTLVTRDPDNRLLLNWTFDKLFVLDVATVDDDGPERARKRITLAMNVVRLATTDYSVNPQGATGAGGWDRVNNTVPPGESLGGIVAGAGSGLESTGGPTRTLGLGGALGDVRVTDATAGVDVEVTDIGGVFTTGARDLREFKFNAPLQASAGRFFSSVATTSALGPTVNYTVRDANNQAITTWTLGNPGTSQVYATSLRFAVDEVGNATTTYGLTASGFSQTVVDPASGTTPAYSNTSLPVSRLTSPPQSQVDFGNRPMRTGADVVTLQVTPTSGSAVGGSVDLSEFTFSGEIGSVGALPSLGDVVLTGPASAATSGFVDMAASGGSLQSAVLRFRDSTGAVRRQLSFNTLVVRSIEITDPGEGAVQAQMRVTLDFRGANDTYTPVSGAPVTASVSVGSTVSTTGSLVNGGINTGSQYRIYFLRNSDDAAGGRFANSAPYVDLISASFAVSNQVDVVAGLGVGSAELGSVSLSAVTGIQSPGLINAMASGRRFDRAQIFRKDAAGQLTTAWTFQNAYVESVRATGVSGNGLLDNLTLVYGAVTTGNYNPNGTLANPPSGWNQVTNGLSTTSPFGPPTGFGVLGSVGEGSLSGGVVDTNLTLDLPAVSGISSAVRLLPDDFVVGATNTASFPNGALVLGTPELNVLTFSRELDSYNQFIRLTGQSAFFSAATLTASATPNRPAARFVADVAFVTKVTVLLDDGSAPRESVEITYRTLTQTFTPYDAAGNPGTPASASYNQATAQATGSTLSTQLGVVPTRTAELVFDNGAAVPITGASWTGLAVNLTPGTGVNTSFGDLGQFTFTAPFDRQTVGLFRGLAGQTLFPGATYFIRDGAGQVLGSWRLGGSFGATTAVIRQSIAADASGQVQQTFTMLASAVTEAAAATDNGTSNTFGFSRPANAVIAGPSSSLNFGNTDIPDETRTATGIVTVDVTPVAVLQSTSFDFQTRQAVVMNFDRNASAIVNRNSFTLVNVTTNQPFPTNVGTLSFNPSGTQATLLATNLLADGNYRLTYGPTTLDFHVLAGDANRDKRVNFDDLLILASNYNSTGRTFSQGNFNYDASGNVNFDDLLILASRYNVALPGVVAPPPPAPIVAGSDDDDADDVLN